MTGNANDAELALYYVITRQWDKALNRDGTSREVFLINGVIYKVETIPGTNAEEYDTMRNMSDALPTGVFYPNVSMFNIGGEDIIAMDYIKGQAIYQCPDSVTGDTCDAMCMTDEELDILVPVMNDPSGMNAIRTNNGIYIIDAF